MSKKITPVLCIDSPVLWEAVNYFFNRALEHSSGCMNYVGLLTAASVCYINTGSRRVLYLPPVSVAPNTQLLFINHLNMPSVTFLITFHTVEPYITPRCKVVSRSGGEHSRLLINNNTFKVKSVRNVITWQSFNLSLHSRRSPLVIVGWGDIEATCTWESTS